MASPGNFRLKYLIFGLIPALALLALVEVSLRAAGFYYSDTPLMMTSLKEDPDGVVNGVIRYNNRDGTVHMVKDSKQLWVPVHSFEEKFSKEKPGGMIRIAALGDSCTMGCTATADSYPALMQDILNAGGARYEVMNAGVGSHSSFQGLQRLKYAVLPYRPDILTVYFGWNDHWITSVPDKDVRLKSPLVTAVLNFLENFRAYQAYHYLISEVVLKRSRPEPQNPAAPQSFDWIKMRVAPEDYRANLNAMIDLAQKQGLKILLVTAPYDPAGFQPSSNFPFPREALVQVHENYLGIVRETAAMRGVPLLDLAGQIGKGTPQPVFSEDGVHFNPWGCRYIAEQFVAKLRELGWVS